MNFRVSELTEMALQVLDYKMYDRNGAPSESLCQLIEKHQVAQDNDHTDGANADAFMGVQHKTFSPNERIAQLKHEQQFMAEFNIMDVNSVVDDPTQYIQSQMKSFYAQLQERILQTNYLQQHRSEVKYMLEMNAKRNQKEVVSFCATVRKGCAKAIKSVETEYAGNWLEADVDQVAMREEKKKELLEEFNMLLELLKFILDDTPDDWSELDKILKLLQTSNDALPFVK